MVFILSMGRIYVNFLFVCFVFINGFFGVFASTPPPTQTPAVLHDSTRLRHYAELSENYFRNQRFDRQLMAIKSGFALSKKLQTTRFHAKLYYSYGLWYRSQKQSNQSLKMFQLALAFGKRDAQRYIIEWAGYYSAVTYADLAYRTGSTEAHRRCVKQLFENIEYTNKNRSFKHSGYNYSLLASIYQENGNDSLATFYQEKQSPLLKRFPEPAKQLYYLTNELEIALYKKNFRDIQMYLNQFLQFHQQEKYWDDYQYLMLDIIEQFVHYGKFDQAFQLLQKVKNTPKLMKALDTNSKFLFYHELATIYLERKQYPFAQLAYDQAVVFSKEEPGALGDQLKLMVIQQKLLENQGQFKQALSLLKVIQQRKDSITFNQYNSKIISSEESLKQKEKQAALRQQLQVEKLNQRLKTEEVDNLQFLQRIYFLLLVFILGILVLIGNQYYRIRKQTSIIKNTNARLYQMMAIIGHDLRSPITSLLGRLGQISVTNELIKNQIPPINNLLLTTDNLLFWAHGQQENPLKPHPQVVTLKEIIDEVLELYEISIEIAQINIQMDIDLQAMVLADENHLRIIVRNLFQNAINYSPSGGGIFLEIKVSGQDVSLLIENTVQSLQPKQANRKKKGLGLGLQLVKELMHINGGDLMIDHGAENFKVELKFASVA